MEDVLMEDVLQDKKEMDQEYEWRFELGKEDKRKGKIGPLATARL